MKSELQEYFLKMLIPLYKFYKEGSSGLKLGATGVLFGLKVAELEGLSRVLWGLTPYWAGGGKECNDIKKIYAQAFSSGTDKEHPEYWGDLKDNDQRMVEMAAISLNFMMATDTVWEALNQEEKRNVAAWLNQINQYALPDNNWLFFNVITNLSLKKCGMPYSEERILYGIERYESFYLGNGWYSDGHRPQMDYYTSFGIHFYSLLYAYLMKDEDSQRCELYKERAKLFAKSFVYWFDEDGKGLPFGRSQTYRFAQVAFWSIYAMTMDEKDESLGVVKGILMRHFRYWMKQPIFDNGGVLSTGYCYPNLLMSEEYNSSGSPYWAFKAFLCLSLADDHPFWTVEEKPFPVLKDTQLIQECNMLIQQRKGEVIALTAGQYPGFSLAHAPEKYSKFAYSSRFGFSVPRSYLNVSQCAPDSMLAIEINDMIYVRKRCIEYSFDEHRVYAKWSPVEGIVIETELFPTEKGHIRKHKIESKFSCIAYDSGFSYPRTKETNVERNNNSVKIFDANGYSMIMSKDGESIEIDPSPNTNLIFPLTKIPSIVYKITEGIQCFESYIDTDMKEGIIVIGRGDCYEIQTKRAANPIR